MTINITCPKCNTTNRIPKARLADKPSCGKCKEGIFNGTPTELTAANYTKLVINSELPVLIDCWASWCGPCQQFTPIFDQAAKTLEPNIRLLKLDTQAQQSIAAQWSIRSIPTLLLFKHGKEVARSSGAMSLSDLNNWLKAQGVS